MPTITGAFVAELETYTDTPTEPATCSPAVESVMLNGQVDGSVVPAIQTRARSVVGETPVA
jgi:hypothetical protein